MELLEVKMRRISFSQCRHSREQGAPNPNEGEGEKLPNETSCHEESFVVVVGGGGGGGGGGVVVCLFCFVLFLFFYVLFCQLFCFIFCWNELVHYFECF